MSPRGKGDGPRQTARQERRSDLAGPPPPSGNPGKNPPFRLPCRAAAPFLKGTSGNEREGHMKGIIAWFMGVPLIVIILLYAFGYF
jgi:hypothetical protein